MFKPDISKILKEKEHIFFHTRKEREKIKKRTDILLSEFIFNVLNVVSNLYSKEVSDRFKKAVIGYFMKRKYKVLEINSYMKKNKLSYDDIQNFIIRYHFDKSRLKLKEFELFRFIAYDLIRLIGK